MSPTSEKDREPDYPTFHYDGRKELDLPDEGEMTIKFRKVSSTSSVNKEGEHRYACTIEVQSICDVEDGDEDDVEAPVNTRGNGTADALDKILTTMQKMVAKDEEVHEMVEGK
jgi:hypothetical protein